MDQKQIFELIDKFEESSLSELKVENEDFKIHLKNAVLEPCGSAPVYQTSPIASSTPPVPASSESPASSTPEGGNGNNEIITSPIVGTFYRAPATDAPPFVEEGSIIQTGDSICIIEAMKIMNKLEAEFSCEIVKILAENGQMVEYGAPLFEVRRN